MQQEAQKSEIILLDDEMLHWSKTNFSTWLLWCPNLACHRLTMLGVETELEATTESLLIVGDVVDNNWGLWEGVWFGVLGILDLYDEEIGLWSQVGSMDAWMSKIGFYFGVSKRKPYKAILSAERTRTGRSVITSSIQYRGWRVEWPNVKGYQQRSIQGILSELK